MSDTPTEACDSNDQIIYWIETTQSHDQEYVLLQRLPQFY